MSFTELAISRKSIRNYNSDNISDEVIMDIITAAQAAPSAGNCQPWHFFVIKDKDVIKRIVDESCKQSFIMSAPVVFVVCADIQRTIGRYADRGRNLYCIQDTAAAIQNMLLCAKSHGIGTCWCGAFNEDALSGILKLDSEMRPVAIIPAGYYDEEPQSRGRRAIDEIVTFM